MGACRCALGITDSVVIAHSVAGCGHGVNRMHMQQDMDDTRLLSTGLYEDDIIGGGEKKLREAIRYALDVCNPSVVFVVCGCTPQIMEDDVAGIIAQMDTNVPLIALLAPGFQGNCHTGTQNALLSLVGLIEPTQMRDKTVNLIGLFPDDFQMTGDVAQIKRLLSPFIHLNAIFPCAPLKAVRTMASASLNLVLPGFEEVGRYMKDTFGVPYLVVSYPYGLEASSRFAQQVYSFFGLSDDSLMRENEQTVLEKLLPFQSHIRQLLAAPCAVIGDSNQGVALQAFLDRELAMCVELFDTKDYGDLHEIEKKLADSPVALLFGDSFSKGIAQKMDIPHINYCYPVVDQITCSARGYAGYEGCLYLVEDIINTIIRYDTARE
jgi:nitrogenase molybdenum-iron protein beta chain